MRRVRAAAHCFDRRAAEGELDEELRFHFDAAVERYVSAGMAPEAARRRARVEYGGIEQIKEECRQSWGSMAVGNIGRDFVQAMRGIRRAPGFAAVAALTLGIGVATNATLFSLIYGVVLRPLPVRDAGSIRNVHVAAMGKDSRGWWNGEYRVSFAELEYMRAHARTAEFAGVTDGGAGFRGAPGRDRARPAHHRQSAAYDRGPACAGEVLRAIGSIPRRKRSRCCSELRDVAEVFRRRSGCHWPQLKLNRTVFTIVGVADETTKGPLMNTPDLWVPLTMESAIQPDGPGVADANTGWIELLGRKSPGSSDAQMTAEMRVLAQQALAAHQSRRKAVVTVARGAFFNAPDIVSKGAPVIAVLFLASGMVLVLAASNVANMLLARGLSRQREIAIRLSIGAGAGRIVQQFLTESLVLALLGASAGLLLSQLAVQGVLAEFARFGPFQIDVTPDAPILLFTFALAAATGLLFGLMPALRLVRGEIGSALKSGGPATVGGGQSGRRMQSVLAALQVTVTVVLLANAGLLLRGFVHALNKDTGQKLHNILVASADLSRQQYTADKARRYMESYRQAAAAMPGVTSVSFVWMDPLVAECNTEARLIAADGSTGPGNLVGCNAVGPGFFRTFGTRLLGGREFSPADMVGKAKAAIVDERFVRRFIGRGNPLGRRIRSGDDEYEIVGIAATVSGLEPGSDDLPMLYRSVRGDDFLGSWLLIGYAGDGAALRRQLVDAAVRLDPAVTGRATPIEANVEEALVPARLAASAASTLGGLGLVLACTGIYGVVAFMVPPAARRGYPHGARRIAPRHSEADAGRGAPSGDGRRGNRTASGLCSGAPDPRLAVWGQHGGPHRIPVGNRAASRYDSRCRAAAGTPRLVSRSRGRPQERVTPVWRVRQQ